MIDLGKLIAQSDKLREALEEAEDVLAAVLDQWEGKPLRYVRADVEEIHVRVLEALKE